MTKDKFNIVEAGKYYWSILIGCFYTDKDGRRIRHWTIMHPDDNLKEMKLKIAKSLDNRAKDYGAWSLDVPMDELNKLGCADIHKICFSPF